MKNYTNLLKKMSLVLLMIVLFLAKINCSEAQDLSNGMIDFIYQPGTGGVQTAIWVEDNDGNYIGTVFITDFIGRNGGGNRSDSLNIDYSSGNRWSALPIWAHKRNVIDTTFGIDNLYPPAEGQPAYPADMDAVSGATPTTGIQMKNLELFDLEYGQYRCRIEVNHSFDQNDYHDYSYYRGQPSLVWNVTINVGDIPDSSIVLDYAGYGSSDGSDGDINSPDSTITTAEDLLAEIEGCKFKVVYTPGFQGVESFDSLSAIYAFILNQNYPNPFNTSTVISYTIYSSAFVILKAYDVLGNEVKTLVSKFQVAGDYNVEFDFENLSAGVYFYRLNVDGILSKPKKMLFAR